MIHIILLNHYHINIKKKKFLHKIIKNTKYPFISIFKYYIIHIIWFNGSVIKI